MKEGTFDWTSEEIKIESRLVFHQNEPLRITILDPKVSVSYSHYVNSRNSDRASVYRCLKLDGKECPRCKAGDQPRPRFGATVLVYRSVETKVWEIVPWLFGADKFSALRRLAQSGVKFLGTDLLVTCHNEKFQNVKIEAIPSKGLWLDWGFKDEVVKAYKDSGIHIMHMITSDKEGFETAPAKAERTRSARSTAPTTTRPVNAPASAQLSDAELALFDADGASAPEQQSPDLDEALADQKPKETPKKEEPPPKQSRKDVEAAQDAELDRLIAEL